ncbi:DUF4232 domain-containing protein [Streptomyces sp. NPDC052077]|uniref:DUF4232 domain-containing protein n=1 Tax=Streptomyces sp. NPDC052077 TaxID=3154757 RepID=UPI00341F1926
MRTSSRLLAGSGVLVVSLLLTACGTRTTGAEAGPSSSAGRCGEVRGDAGDLARDGVRITGAVEREGAAGGPGEAGASAGVPEGLVRAERLPTAGGRRCSVRYSVTNDAAEPYTYTVVFSLLDEQGRALSNVTETVPGVGAGRTVRRTLDTGGGLGEPTRTRILDVKKVPSAEAPAAAGDCPASGLRLTADDGDAAMGLRVVGLHLENCGSRPYALYGYPVVGLLDDALRPVGGVEILRGTGDIPMAGDSEPPRPLTLPPGGAAAATLAWRNTTEAGEPVTVPYVRVRPKEGADPVIVAPNLDLGTTGRLGVSAWREAATAGNSDRPRGS